MTDETRATLIKLSDTDYSVAPTDEDIRDRRVVDTDGDEVGTVHDLLIDRQDQKVRLLRVDHGGILGFGVTSTFVPVEAITEITDDEVRISHSGRHVAETPRYDPDLVDDEYYRRVYAHYGYSDTGYPVVATRGMGLY
jgi:sporulation protein YlmC with PRC-barrel domain